jgi:hypothetical protein
MKRIIIEWDGDDPRLTEILDYIVSAHIPVEIYGSEDLSEIVAKIAEAHGLVGDEQ